MALREPNSARSGNSELNDSTSEAFLIAAHPEVAAEIAGLRYVSDNTPGIKRKKRGKGFVYIGLDGKVLRDPKTLERIQALRIPPAWQDVWICAKTNGHLQCTGRDARNRKQYLYHAEWGKVRNETKFERMRAFGLKLPMIRRRILADLKKQGLPRERVLSALLGVMDKTLIRVGNEEYAKTNNSYGLTTMRNRHVTVRGSSVAFHFRGKSGKSHEIELEDPRLARVLKKCQGLPGQELFLYEDPVTGLTPIDSGDVNAYLKEICGEDFTAKDFRTWGGSVRAMKALLTQGPCDKEHERKRRMTQAIREASEHLGNTLTICRKYYIHPSLFENFENGALFTICEKFKLKKGRRTGLKVDEAMFLSLLDGKKKGTSRKRAVVKKILEKIQQAS